MPKFMILGAGRQGTAVGWWLENNVTPANIVFVDQNKDALNRALEICQIKNGGAQQEDLAGRVDLRKVIESATCVISCLPYFMNQRISDACAEMGIHYCDLGGNTDIVRQQLKKHDVAVKNNCIIMPDCGIAPGTVGILAEYWKDKFEYSSVELLCGGLPQGPDGIMKYETTFSMRGLINEYFEPCEVSEGGKLKKYPGMSNPITYDFRRSIILSGVGVLEAFNTSGGASIAPEIYAKQEIDYTYKTLRYPGHRDVILAMKEMGLFDGSVAGPVTAQMEKALASTGRDLIVSLITVHDYTSTPHVIELIDFSERPFTAMERTTGFSAAICAAYISGMTKYIPESGAFAPFQAVPPQLMIDELRKTGVTILIEE